MSLNAKPKRTPESLIKSLEFDSEKKILIVEGITDRLFLEFLQNKENTDVVILEIENIEISTEFDGNKGKIIQLISKIPTTVENINYFIDRDYDLSESNVNTNTILTDFKDLETYLFNEKYLDKFLKIGLKSEKLTANKIYQELLNVQYFGFVRKYSIIKKLNLPINSCNEKLEKYVTYNKINGVVVDLKRYLSLVIQKAKLKITPEELENEIKSFIEDDKSSPEFIIHGKDLIKLLQIICNNLGYKQDIESAFWMSFDQNNVEKYKNLKKVVDFIS